MRNELRPLMLDMEREIDGPTWPEVDDLDILREFLDRPVRVPSGEAPV